MYSITPTIPSSATAQIDVLKKAKADHPELEVIVLTAHATVEALGLEKKDVVVEGHWRGWGAESVLTSR